eukprot:SAG25_NODE_2448_length_1597_cov_1.040721_2_plen_29_part_01
MSVERGTSGYAALDWTVWIIVTAKPQLNR